DFRDPAIVLGLTLFELPRLSITKPSIRSLDIENVGIFSKRILQTANSEDSYANIKYSGSRTKTEPPEKE
ncbi:hypothetical protein AVEN_28538-1, partial [Araneus ventricosus]